MKIIIFGKTGMLGQAMLSHLKNYNELTLIAIGREELDISKLNIDAGIDERLVNLLKAIKPDVIVNCAAIVSLDFCEKNPSSSKVVNTYFPQMLALWCNSKGTKLIHISTDHLYYQMQGDGNLLHVEEDPCSVANRYAGQKLLAEEMVKSIDNKALIIRTNLIGCRQNNKTKTFIEWACGELRGNRELNGFIDYYTTPIYA